MQLHLGGFLLEPRKDKQDLNRVWMDIEDKGYDLNPKRFPSRNLAECIFS